MARCIICRFETVLDDIVLQQRDGCVCLRCYSRETGSAWPMPKPLRLALMRLLSREPAGRDFDANY